MMFDTVSLSSDDDVPLKALEANVPLKALKADVPLKALKADVPLKALEASYVPIKSAALKTHSVHNCDFCEEVFFNKYDALIHNGKHIIIPLIKKEYHQCPLCLFYFTSRYKLKHHIRNKHKNEDNPETVNLNTIVVNKETVNVKPVIKENKEILSKKQENGKTKYIGESKETNKIATKHESDDEDDLPLVNGNFKLETRATKETEKGAFKCETEILKEALLKDVKVVIEKIPLPLEIEPKVFANKSLKVPKKLEIDVKEDKKSPIDVIPKKSVNDKDVIVPDTFDTVKASSHNVKQTNENGNAKTRNRLTFEDDIDDLCDDEVMKDLTKDCIVDLNLFDEPWLDEIAKSITNDDVIGVNDDVIGVNDDLIRVNDDDLVITIDDDDNDEEKGAAAISNEKLIDDVYTPSVHHDELIKPGVYRCRKCQQMFPTRFNQIQHEMTHMHIRKPRPVLCEYCDRFIATKKALKDHIASKHLQHYRPRTFQNCSKCGLKYNNYGTHLENYHSLHRCHLCNNAFDTEIDKLNHIRGHLVKIKCNQCEFVASELEIREHQRRFHTVCVSTATFNLCEICCLFLKNRHRQYTQYVFGETVSQLGSRLDCEHCGNKFFHLTQVVRKIVKGRPADRFAFEKDKEKKKCLTNKERLKNIQQRLKMINKLSRF